MAILVAGGTGFIGGTIVRHLCRRGRLVKIFTRSLSKAKDKFAALTVDICQGDVRDLASLERALAGCEVVVNCVQFPNFPIEDKRRGHTFDAIDRQGTENLVKTAKKTSVRRFIYLSGAGTRPEADRVWFRAKWLAETAIRESGLIHTIFRPSWVYGPEDSALNRFVAFARYLPFVPVFGNGRQRIQPVFVEDVARCVGDSLELAGAENQTFEIGGPEVLTMDEIIHTVLEVMGKRRALLHVPPSIPKLAGRMMEAIFPSPPLTRDAIDFIMMEGVVDNSFLLQTFPLQLTPLRKGLATYLKESGS